MLILPKVGSTDYTAKGVLEFGKCHNIIVRIVNPWVISLTSALNRGGLIIHVHHGQITIL